MGIRTDHSDVPLAIIGMGCRLPGAEDLDAVLGIDQPGAVGDRRSSCRPARSVALLPSRQRGARQDLLEAGRRCLPEREFDFERYPVPHELRDFGRPDAPG